MRAGSSSGSPGLARDRETERSAHIGRRREFIEVDAGLNGDIERAVVQRMIELIRRYYSGNFNWESLRLGRTVVLSARPEHQQELEDFLIKEFFRVGAQYPP